ncbi:MAG: PD40 domain-containing protein [Actinobacteria bacterium]|nr:PD40 domain-containing protein [Actinomycetota bacterium]
MKRATFLITFIAALLLVLFNISSCVCGKIPSSLAKGEEDAADINEGVDESPEIEIEEEDEKDNDAQAGEQAGTASEDEPAYDLLYNPPEGGSPENIGKIIFCSESEETEENGDYYLYSINPDGSGMTRLPFFGNWMWHPAWSPEYSRIAYSANPGNTDKIFIMAADGSENRQLTFGESRDKFPTWSPDGKMIAYISYIDGTPNLSVIDIYGNNQKQLTFVEGEDTVVWPGYSPVEDAIAYTYNSAEEGIGARIIVVRSDGTKIVELPAPGNPEAHFSHPGWSPDGKVLYFLSNQSRHVEIWKIDYYKLIHNLTAAEDDKYDDLGLMQLTDLYGNGVAADYRPRVSPDGKKIVFCGGCAEAQISGFNLITINTDGTGITNITDFTIDACEWPDW